MLKKLFFLVALLVPGLAYGGNPSADLSVQIAPPTSAGCGPVPADAQTMGFTTVALCNDFTVAIPNTVGTGLPSNWLNCNGNNYVAGAVWNYNGNSANPCNQAVSQAIDTAGGGKLALDVHYNASWQPASGDFNNQLTTITTEPYPLTRSNGCTPTTCTNSNTWGPNGYYEWRFRASWNGGQGYGGGPGITQALFTTSGPGFGGSTTPWWEVDVFESIFGCCDNSIVGHNGANPPSGMFYSLDMSTYHTAGALWTSDHNGNGAVCFYLDGVRQKCGAASYVGVEGTTRSQFWIQNGIYCNGSSVDISCQTPPTYTYQDLWVSNVRVLTCAGGPNGDPCLTSSVFAP